MPRDTSKVWMVKMLRDNDDLTEECGEVVPEALLVYETIGIFRKKVTAIEYIQTLDPDWTEEDEDYEGMDSFKCFELEDFILDVPVLED